MRARIPFAFTLFILFVVLGAGLALGLQGVAQAGVPGQSSSQLQAQRGGKGRSSGQQQPNSPQAPACGPDWQVVTSPNATTSGVLLNGVAVVSGDDVWAVGYYAAADTTYIHGLIEHWNGSAWEVMRSPRASITDDRLYGVAATSANDVWAVGQYLDGTNVRTLIEHWDGTAWSIVSSPNQPSSTDTLYAVAVASAGDVWAVGLYYNSTYDAFQTLIEHWNGTSWVIVASPNSSTFDNGLQGVAVTSSNEVWAVGYYNTATRGPSQTLVEEWNGSIWSTITSPSPGTNGNNLEAVAVVSSSDVWAVGYQVDGIDQRHTLVLHWVGQEWQVVSSPDPGMADDALSAVAVTSANDVWAVGSFTSDSGVRTLVEHWDGTSWTAAESPYQENSILSGVAVSSANDVWAVGNHYVPDTNPSQTLIEHWNGTGWAISSNADQSRSNELYGIAAVSADDIWAVGVHNGGSGIDARSLVEHWNGFLWNIVSGAPDPPSAMGSSLNSVAVVSADDVWAVGSYYNGISLRTLVEHWNRGAWSVVGSPNETTGDNELESVAVANSTDVWAVGYFVGASNHRQTLTEYWNGTNWTIVSSPNVGTGDNVLNGVAAYSAFDVWAVGYHAGTTANQTLIEHWNGFAWSVRNSANAGSGSNFLTSISALASSDAWAVGYYDDDGLMQALIEHWDGSSWSVVTSPPVGGWDNYLLGVSASSADDVWAVGYSYNGMVKQTLVEYWNGSSWSVVNSPNVGTSDNYLRAVAPALGSDIWAVGDYDNGTGTGTLTERYNLCAPSPTPTVVPTACSIEFSDVPSGSTFYPYIHCLACRGIANGYADGTFHPSARVTRGQLSKIVSNAAGFNDPQPDQLFQDESPGSDFFTYTARLASRGLISGYPCGLPLEPCGPTHLPYFRPYNNATRGQIAKIVSNAAGFNDPPSGQLFQDVAPGTAFYTYTQRLASRSITAGYPCGGPGEPCVEPENLPYYRPNNNATRGQTSKVVAISFFPDCETPSR